MGYKLPNFLLSFYQKLTVSKIDTMLTKKTQTFNQTQVKRFQKNKHIIDTQKTIESIENIKHINFFISSRKTSYIQVL